MVVYGSVSQAPHALYDGHLGIVPLALLAPEYASVASLAVDVPTHAACDMLGHTRRRFPVSYRSRSSVNSLNLASSVRSTSPARRREVMVS